MTATTTRLPASDGRRLRREQNREAVIDALLDLFETGMYTPTSADIAAQAGLSPRSLFRYFDDVDDLHRAAADRQIQVALPLVSLGVGPADLTAAKIIAVARSRVRLYEHVGPASRALRISVRRNGLLTGQLERIREFLTVQLRVLFGPELARLPAVRRDAVLQAVDVLCSFESYDLLSRDGNAPEAAVIEVLVTALTALLARQPYA